MRHSERSLSHDIAQERAVKMAEELAAAPGPRHPTGDFPCARKRRCSMRWPLGTRLVIKRVEEQLGQNSRGVLSWWMDYWSARLNPCAVCETRPLRPGRVLAVARVLRPAVRDTKFKATRPARA